MLVGAAIFDALESDTEDFLRNKYQLAETSMLHTYNISHNEYIELEDIVIKYQPHKAGAQWKFPGAFYFSLTVITTIGKICLLMNITYTSSIELLHKVISYCLLFRSINFYSLRFLVGTKKKVIIACQLT